MDDPKLKALLSAPPQPVYLISGDLVLAEPAGARLAEALAAKVGSAVEVRHRPPALGAILDDLRTYSLFGGGKIILAVDSAVLADRGAAAELIDDAEEALPVPEGELPSRAREGASRLLQALKLFGIDPFLGEARSLISELPSWALEGGQRLRQKKPRGRSKKDAESLADGLAELLEAARAAGISGIAEGALAELGAIVTGGLPPGHALILAERSVAADHPVVNALRENGALLELGGVTSDRSGFSGLEAMAAELARETGVGIRRDALAELARRTLRQERQGGVEADSTARLAGEYRKLANLARLGKRGASDKAPEIERAMVVAAVEDRGQEDVWQILDAIGTGKSGEALERYHRLMAAAEDPVAARLSFFALLAALCRQITAIRGLMGVLGIAAGERNFKRFEEKMAPALQRPLEGGRKSPLAGLKPYRLYKAYLAACRVPEKEAALLPWRVLETELRLKGESHEPDAALALLMLRLATPPA